LARQSLRAERFASQAGLTRERDGKYGLLSGAIDRHSTLGHRPDIVSRVNRGAERPKTPLVVESKLQIPWSKPEDIPFDATQPLPRFGGWYPQGFCGGMCDASVRFFPDNETDLQMLW